MLHPLLLAEILAQVAVPAPAGTGTRVVAGYTILDLRLRLRRAARDYLPDTAPSDQVDDAVGELLEAVGLRVDSPATGGPSLRVSRWLDTATPADISQALADVADQLRATSPAQP
jgi:hypothetical protein